MQPNNPSNKSIIFKWLNDRGITDEVIAVFNITEHKHREIGECIRIPISPDGKFAKYRRHPLDDRKPKYLYDKGAKVSLFGADQILDLDGGPVLITEGELDTLVAWSKNIPAVSSTGGAMSFQEEWVSAFAGHKVYICFDNDKAGAEGMVKVLGVLPDAYVVLVPEMAGVKDISDYVSRGGDLHGLLKTAKQYKSIEDVEEDFEARASAWQPTTFHEAYIAKHRVKKDRATGGNYIGDDRVLKANDVPMTNFIDFKGRKARCPWHNEKTPSLHYYPKTNSAYCFGGCGKAYDTINAYMMRFGVDFKTAVDDLNKMV